MIVAETADGYQFVTQPDHAALAGQFADRWGNDRFDPPAPRAALVAAAYEHDLGWWAYDRRPHLADGTPVDFREMPPDVWSDLYDEGVAVATAVDPYVGLLVAMHGAGLRNRRYGLSPDWPATPPAYAEFVARQEERQSALLAEMREAGDERVSASDAETLSYLHGDGRVPDGHDSPLWTAYRLLQAWDTLSLSFCVTHDPPGYEAVDAVPTAEGEPDATLVVERAADGEFRIDPYPFDAPPLDVTVPLRTVPARSFDDEESLTRAYYDAGREMRTVSLRRAE